MLKKSFISFAIIVSGLFLADQANGQSSVKRSVDRGVQSQSINSPRDVATGQLIDTSTGEVAWVRATPAKVRGNSSPGVNRNRPSMSLIDTSTGEIVWADEVRSTRRRGSTLSDGDL